MSNACPDPGSFDWRALSPAQRAALRMRLTEQAREARARTIGAALKRLAATTRELLSEAFRSVRRLSNKRVDVLNPAVGPDRFIDMSLVHSGFRTNHIGQMAIRAATSVQMIWARYRRRRLRARELAELRAMDDMALKDIGISRLEIRAAIRSGTNLRSGRE